VDRKKFTITVTLKKLNKYGLFANINPKYCFKGAHLRLLLSS